MTTTLSDNPTPAVEAPTSETAAATAAAASATATPTATTPTPVLGILGLVSALSGLAFGLVIPLSIVAIVLGWLALKREPANRTLAIWTIVLGAIPGGLILIGGAIAAAFLVPFGLVAAFGGF